MKGFKIVALLFVVWMGLHFIASVPCAPITVAEQSFLTQTASIGSTTLYTPDSDGNFRVSVYSSSTKSMGSSVGMCPFLSWTDDTQAHTAQSLVQNDGEGACLNSGGSGSDAAIYGHAIWFIHALSGQAISISTSVGSVPASTSYNMYVEVEKL